MRVLADMWTCPVRGPTGRDHRQGGVVGGWHRQPLERALLLALKGAQEGVRAGHL